MIYYDANTNKVDDTKVIQNITFNVTNAMATTGIQGYSVVCTEFDVPNMRISFQITHIGYPVEILFYTGSVFKREKEFSTTYKTTLDLIKDPSLTPQQRQDAVDAQIAKTNTSIAMMLYDQIKTHQVLKSFEKLVYDKYVVPKNFPSPEQMWEEFKAFYEAVKSIPSPIPFPCTIADWWNRLEQNIKKNTAFWLCTSTHDYSLMKKYITGEVNDYMSPSIFSVMTDLYEVYSFSSHDDMVTKLGTSEIVKTPFICNLEFFEDNFVNELNGIPTIMQSSIQTVQPQQQAV
jgi:hypothetical protein